jgi:hypothetical protein
MINEYISDGVAVKATTLLSVLAGTLTVGGGWANPTSQ